MLSTSVGATEDVSEHVDSHVGAVLFNGITSNNGLFDVSI